MARESHHPDIEDLLRYQEGSLPATGRNAVQAHLAECVQCAHELERIAASGISPVSAPPVSDLLANLAQTEQRLQQPSASGEALKRRVQSELIPYLGATAADRILQPVASGGGDLLSTIEPLLRLFLGRAATARLVDRIVERAIMRT